MMEDPRGPIRTITAVRCDPGGGFTTVVLSCEHTQEWNQIYTYRVGDEGRCFACANGAKEGVIRKGLITEHKSNTADVRIYRITEEGKQRG